MKIARLMLLIAPWMACDVTPEWPATVQEWARYTDERSGVSLEYPAQCTIHRNDAGALIRFNDSPIIAFSFTTMEVAKKRGLWAAHAPADSCQLGGREGELYRYDHHDVFLGMHTVSWVVPHDGKWIALELRMKCDEPGSVQRRVIESLSFASSNDGGS